MNNSACMRMLHGCQDALQHYESVRPLKSGNKKGQRPFGANRKHKQLLIEKSDTEDIIVRLWGNPVLTFHPNDTLTIDLCGYNTPSTREVVKYGTPFDIVVKKSQPFLQIRQKQYVYDKPLIVDIATHVVVNADPQKVWRLDRKRIGQIRKEFEPFLSYCKAMGSLHTEITKPDIERAAEIIDDNIPHPQYGSKLKHVQTTGRYTTDVEYIRNMVAEIKQAQAVEDLNVYFARFIQLAVSSGVFSWRFSLWHTSSENFAKPALDKFGEVLKFVYADELFTQELVELGQGIADANHKYVKANQQ